MARRSPALFAWLLCGTLDIVYAAASSVVQGGTVSSMLHAVASGPFGDGARAWGIGGDIAGLATHYAIMAAMVATWFFVARRWTALTTSPWWLTGTIYGLILYVIMNGIVLPLRFGSPFPPNDLVKGAIALFPHIFFVGWPLAWLTRQDAR
ncbi:hypothetical protein ASD67_06125 [Sphingopyxis sp. Root1497]|uniref:hypothetical protein n=1 Tax=Sphingopyxis sp. Root1497 TaxID=1736474 RepID=UPI0006F3B309|nr:hypothetical protein [Sphingopyxis sp. Root1497]KQZ64090.1 hypothetical protein ASD67_06125 [Sphingopyxis sp. Root1497]